jgi:hypothetical protein
MMCGLPSWKGQWRRKRRIIFHQPIGVKFHYPGRALL